MLFKIAIKNLLGARLRTLLNVFVTSISFFIILFISGMYDGMRQYAKQVTIDTEIAGGAYWHPKYDPMDPMSYEDAHSLIPEQLMALINRDQAFPVLVSQASIYPNGRIMPVIMRGISPTQSVINMEGINKNNVSPTEMLSNYKNKDIEIPVLIGSGMAEKARLEIGDTFIIRWLDSENTYDAEEGTIVHIIN